MKIVKGRDHRRNILLYQAVETSEFVGEWHRQKQCALEEALTVLLENCTALVNAHIKDTGWLRCEDNQRACLIMGIKNLQMLVNGIEPTDLED